MPPIKVFTNSPINAAKPSGTTPQTSQQNQDANAPPPPTTTTATSQQAAYPAAQPGAAPPAPTGTASFNTTSNYQPTPTQPLSGSGSGSPPAPQPGAVPVPPSGGPASHLPPPPKAGETLQQHHHQQPSHTTTTMPPQMSYAPLSGPTAPAHSLGSSTSNATPSASGYPGPPRPTTLMEGGMGGGSGYGQPQQQPLGYQQNVGAHQQQRSYMDEDGNYDSQDESVWGTAKKWASAAGDSLAKAESEVWKRINKD